MPVITTQYQELFVNQGVDYTVDFLISDNFTGLPVDISLYTFASSGKLSYPNANVAISFQCAVKDGPNGIFTQYLTFGQTANTAPGRYVFDTVCSSDLGATFKPIYGIINVDPGTTPISGVVIVASDFDFSLPLNAFLLGA